ncbi:hypothetical protein KUV51_16630 [Tateyamaria omphalii]|uniref:hypothetical protein n=1 Tax=Tateyamaria omphalii TaxID=299262 RepID=UPI001C99573D|nr:hypothetical protein [Tateyamaria omphalii]MBY5934635.1 hypothetical protein [Tateyamaria omphalii]
MYPGGLRAANTTLLAVLNGGGDVSIHDRHALRRSLDQMDTQAVLGMLEGDVRRRDARAATAVLTTAQALADGRGVRVDQALRNDVNRLAKAADTACSGNSGAATSSQDADSAEQGTERSTGQGGRPLTFREGVVRLSLTFTIYLIFLAFLLGIRRQLKERAAREDQAEDADPIQRFDQSAT